MDPKQVVPLRKKFQIRQSGMSRPVPKEKSSLNVSSVPLLLQKLCFSLFFSSDLCTPQHIRACYRGFHRGRQWLIKVIRAKGTVILGLSQIPVLTLGLSACLVDLHFDRRLSSFCRSPKLYKVLRSIKIYFL